MNTRTLIGIMSFCLPIAAIASGGAIPIPTRDGLIIHGGSTDRSKATGDTILVMGPTGSGAPYIGDFESGWSGWTSVDRTQRTVTNGSVLWDGTNDQGRDVSSGVYFCEARMGGEVQVLKMALVR